MKSYLAIFGFCLLSLACGKDPVSNRSQGESFSDGLTADAGLSVEGPKIGWNPCSQLAFAGVFAQSPAPAKGQGQIRARNKRVGNRYGISYRAPGASAFVDGDIGYSGLTFQMPSIGTLITCKGNLKAVQVTGGVRVNVEHSVRLWSESVSDGRGGVKLFLCKIDEILTPANSKQKEVAVKYLRQDLPNQNSCGLAK